MEFAFCLIMGYLMGCISPSYLLSKSKGVDLRSVGQKNLGTTNAFMILGKTSGILVMLAARLASLMFPGFQIADVTAGGAAVLGHIFPFYLKFRGGKGLATLGGLILATDLRGFLLLAVIAIVLMLITDWGCSASFSTAFFYPIFYFLKTKSFICLVILGLVCLCVIVKHCTNISRLKEGNEPSVRGAIKKFLRQQEEQKYTEE